ncbi:MAG: hypothetical protein IJQ68_05580 [Methanobrevibacter sp.]|uniref:hypothetical protein n=1 Tax=Methanobrevibacter sp. TaxID=66852 RepID=UPI0025D5B226|nr:hypothetical protein [Methanobrevibacter sp.]MBR0271447.1 hypothetical protein [Methanobrevibacter sp.]
MWLVETDNSINLLDECVSLLKEYDLNLDDITVVFKGEVLNNLEKLDVDYDNSWGHCNFDDIQLIIDEYTWFERTSYNGCEKFILKAHPLLSTFKNHESHTEFFLYINDVFFHTCALLKDLIIFGIK